MNIMRNEGMHYGFEIQIPQNSIKIVILFLRLALQLVLPTFWDDGLIIDHRCSKEISANSS